MITEILKQNDASPMPFEEQALVFYAALNGYFDNIPVDNLKETEKKYLEYIKGTHQNDIIEPIRQSNELSAGVEEKLKEAIIGFKQTLS